jgi:uncharacterized protein
MPSLDCPICRRCVSYESSDEVPFRPFCSRRCKLVDLGRWLNEEYRVSEEVPPDPGSEGSIPPPPGKAQE